MLLEFAKMQALGNDELNRMLQALRDLSETGARDQARQLLNDMQKMLDKMQNMQLQMGGGGYNRTNLANAWTRVVEELAA